MVLTRAGFRVWLAGDGAEAPALVGEHGEQPPSCSTCRCRTATASPSTATCACGRIVPAS
jgi:hypothetical protein